VIQILGKTFDHDQAAEIGRIGRQWAKLPVLLRTLPKVANCLYQGRTGRGTRNAIPHPDTQIQHPYPFSQPWSEEGIVPDKLHSPR